MFRVPFRLEAGFHLMIICWAVLGVGFSALPDAAEPTPIASERVGAATPGVSASPLAAVDAATVGPSKRAPIVADVSSSATSFWTQHSRALMMFVLGFGLMAVALALRHRAPMPTRN